MMKLRTPLFAAALAASLFCVDVARADPGHDPVRHGRVALVAGSTLPDASGRIEAEIKPAKGNHPETAKFRVKLRGLVAGDTYTIWGVDPATATLTQFADVTAREDGHADLKIDTHHGDALPFGASLDDLAGGAIEVHDSGGNVVLSGNFPTIFPPRGPSLHGRGELTSSVPGAKGRIEEEFKAADEHHDAESKLRIKVEHLSGDTEYTLWGVEPATLTLTQFGTITTHGDGNGEFKVDTHHGDALPFGASLDDLAGGAVEVHDSGGAVVMTGTFPEVAAKAPKPPKPPKPPKNPPPPVTSETGHADLVATVPGPTGTIDTTFTPANGSTAESSQIEIALHGLAPTSSYSLWLNNPVTFALDMIGTVTADAAGDATFSVDTSAGGTLPFSASLDALAGGTFELHDGTSAVVLAGTFPSTQ